MPNGLQSELLSYESSTHGWSSPIVWGDTVFVTSAVSTRPFKQPSPGLYGNEYIAELQAQGLSDEEILKKTQARDNELPSESAEVRYMAGRGRAYR